MKKRGMSLVTLTITIAVLIGAFYITMTIFTKTNSMQGLEISSENMDLYNIQQLANVAYAGVYFDNLRQGIRRELTAEEIRNRMIKNGTGEINLENYQITVKDGDVFVTIK